MGLDGFEMQKTEDDIRDQEIAKGITRGGRYTHRMTEAPSFSSDTWLCRVCKGPRHAVPEAPRRRIVTVLLECGHRAMRIDVCAAVAD